MQLKDGGTPSFLACGRALFLPLQASLWDLRCLTKKGIAAQEELLPYTVMEVIDFYPRMIDLTLDNEQTLLDKLGEHEAAMSGEKGGAFRCIAFWDAQNEEGILFHKQGREILAAYLPPLTMADVIREQTILCRLKELSQSAEGIPAFLDRPIRSGKHCLSDLLEFMGRGLE